MRGRVQPAVAAGLVALAFALGLLSSLETHGSHAARCNDAAVGLVTYTDGGSGCAAGQLCTMTTGNVITNGTAPGGDIRLTGAAGASAQSFRTPMPVDLGPINAADRGGHVNAIAAGDFDEDGWVDLVGTIDGSDQNPTTNRTYVVFIQNRTFETVGAVTDWTDITQWAVPRFRACTDEFVRLNPARPAGVCNPAGDGADGNGTDEGYLNGVGYPAPQGIVLDIPEGSPKAIVAGRFDRADTKLDVLVVSPPVCATMVPACLYNLNNCFLRLYRGNGDGTFTLQQVLPQVGLTGVDYGEFDWTANNMVVTDWDADGDDDIVLQVHNNLVNPPDAVNGPSAPVLLRNDTAGVSSTVTFSLQTLSGLTSVAGAACGGPADDRICKRGATTVAVADLESDGFKDVIVGTLGGAGLTVRRQTAAGVWQPVETITFAEGAASFVLAGDFDGGKADLLVGTDNWNFAAGNVAGCDVSRDTAAGGCADTTGPGGLETGTGGLTRFFSSKTALGSEVGWTLGGGVWSAGHTEDVTCHEEGTPYATPPTTNLGLVCATVADVAHAASREGVSPGTAGVIYDWDTAALLNYDHDYDCGGSLQVRNPGYSPNRWTTGGTCAADAEPNPQESLDVVVADGNDSRRLYVLPYRKVTGPPSYPACEVVGGVETNWTRWSTVTNPAADKAVVSACVTLTGVTTPGDSDIDIELSNDGGRTGVFVESTMACPAALGGGSCYCASFPARDWRLAWRARLCPTSALSNTPTITIAELRYYTAAQAWDLRGGVTVEQARKYVAMNWAPGNAGRLRAYHVEPGATVDTPVFVVTDENPPPVIPSVIVQPLPADGSRSIFTLVCSDATCASDGTCATGGAGVWTMLAFGAGSAGDARLQRLLGIPPATCGLAAGTAEATTIIAWARSARFTGEVGPAGSSRLGGFYRSTPAVLSAAPEARWRDAATTAATERTAIDTFVNALELRPNLVIAGARDGMVHAFLTVPTSDTNADNGKEAWAFVPPAVAATLRAESTDGGVAWATDTWVDGPPRLYDYYDTSQDDLVAPAGSYRTALVMGQGSGGTSYFALDITDTVTTTGGFRCAGDADGWCATGCIAPWANCGLRVLWNVDHGSSPTTRAGQAISQPAFVRVNPTAAGPETSTNFYRVVFGSGTPRTAEVDAGDSLYMLSLQTGAPIAGWSTAGVPSWEITSTGSTPPPLRFQAMPTPVDVRTAGGVYTDTGDGSHDFIVVGDTYKYLWKVSVDGTTATGAAFGSATACGGGQCRYLTDVGQPMGAPAAVVAGTLVGDPAGDVPAACAGGCAGGCCDWFVLGTGGIESTSHTDTFKIVGVYENGTTNFTNTLAAVGDKVFTNVVVAGDRCLVATSRDDFLNATGGCAAGTQATSSLLEFSCLGTGATTSTIAMSGSVKASLFTRAGVLAFSTSHGDVKTFGTGTGDLTPNASAPVPMAKLWWREIW